MSAINKGLAKIAKDVLEFETLETRNSDALDFKTLSVWAVKEALQLAYLKGQSDLQKEVDLSK